VINMAREDFEIRIQPGGDGASPHPSAGTAGSAGAEPPLGELLKRLTTDAGDLVRAEMTLAKAELRQAGSTLARDGAKVGVAAGLALAGTLALTAFMVLGLGAALDNYWLAALIVGAVLLGIGGFLAKSAVSDIKKRGVMPTQTVDTLRDDARWAKDEAAAVKRELTR
jgi:uncharacterized membrane protein YqjE